MRLITLLALMLLVGGCASTPVRHLASDASLVKPGVSTRSDVQQYLGEPNGRRQVTPEIEEFVYYEDRRSQLGRTPLVGGWIPPEGYEMIIITLEKDLVTGCEFRTFREADQDWIDDFTWEEVQ